MSKFKLFAQVNWYNKGAREGVVRGGNSRNYYLHSSAIQDQGLNGNEDVEPGEIVLIEVLDDQFARHVTRLRRVEFYKEYVGRDDLNVAMAKPLRR